MVWGGGVSKYGGKESSGLLVLRDEVGVVSGRDRGLVQTWYSDSSSNQLL